MEAEIPTWIETARRYRLTLADSEILGLRAEILRLRSENEDLRASAQLWLYLYDAALERANELEARFAASTNETRDDDLALSDGC
jgi:hypothetical protein